MWPFYLGAMMTVTLLFVHMANVAEESSFIQCSVGGGGIYIYKYMYIGAPKAL
jgi:hypothetical protein